MGKTFFKSFVIITLLSLIALFPAASYAQENNAGTSAVFATPIRASITEVADTRPTTLKKFLETYNAPLSVYANDFVTQADKYNLDWKLVAAISGIESTFGKQVPYNCNNAWGYGIYGETVTCFASYDGPIVYKDPEASHDVKNIWIGKSGAIATISKALREQYIDTWGAQDVYAIGHYYAASPTWASRVTYFMNQMDTFAMATQKEELPISL